MNILVTGACGQLGNEMAIVSRNSQKDKYIFTDVMTSTVAEGKIDVQSLDILDLEAIRRMVRENNIKAIINCAAYTNVDKAESDEALCEKLNADGPENLALAIKENDGLLVHISTDYVFGKEPYNTPCKEDRTGTPTGVYGLTKLHGEQKIIASGCNHIIIRTAWLYSEFGKNFCKTMLNLTATKPELKVVFDQVGTPTYALDLAKAIFHIVENRLYEGNTGIYHYSNEGVCSWYDFTKMIAEYAGQTGHYGQSGCNNQPGHSSQPGCNIQPCHSNEFPSPVVRPSYSVLDKTKIKETFGVEVPYWTDSLKKCIANLTKDNI